MAGLGGYGTCNNGVCAVLVCCMVFWGCFISHASFIFLFWFYLCFISVSSLFPFSPTIQPGCDCV